nr:hypothetical protein [uncultured Niameybacter sp.]
MKKMRPIHIFILLMLLGIFLIMNSYDLGQQAGTTTRVTKGALGMTNYSTHLDEAKTNASTEAYKSIGTIVLLIGGIGFVSVVVKNS